MGTWASRALKLKISQEVHFGKSRDLEFWVLGMVAETNIPGSLLQFLCKWEFPKITGSILRVPRINLDYDTLGCRPGYPFFLQTAKSTP